MKQMFGGAMNSFDCIVALRDLTFEVFRKADNGLQRCPNLMTHVGKETLLYFAKLFRFITSFLKFLFVPATFCDVAPDQINQQCRAEEKCNQQIADPADTFTYNNTGFFAALLHTFEFFFFHLSEYAKQLIDQKAICVYQLQLSL